MSFPWIECIFGGPIETDLTVDNDNNTTIMDFLKV